jgi:hypothetical protein
MLGDFPDLFQFASDLDGDLHLFPKNLDEPDYQHRWQVWVLHPDGTRNEAPLCSPMMCVNDGVVTNPHGLSGHQEVAGWWVDFFNSSEIEIAIDSEKVIRIRHPRP